jgi:hypothetical protein
MLPKAAERYFKFKNVIAAFGNIMLGAVVPFLCCCCRNQLTSQIRDLQNDLITSTEKNDLQVVIITGKCQMIRRTSVSCTSAQSNKLVSPPSQLTRPLYYNPGSSNIEVLIFATRAGGNCTQRAGLAAGRQIG